MSVLLGSNTNKLEAFARTMHRISELRTPAAEDTAGHSPVGLFMSRQGGEPMCRAIKKITQHERTMSETVAEAAA